MNPQQAAAMYNRAHQLAAAAAATPASLTLPITTHGTGPIMVPNRQLHELLGRINPQIRMDASVEEVLLELTNDFVDLLVNSACAVARHRTGATGSTSTALNVADLQFSLKREYGIALDTTDKKSSTGRKRKFSGLFQAARKRRTERLTKES